MVQKDRLSYHGSGGTISNKPNFTRFHSSKDHARRKLASSTLVTEKRCSLSMRGCRKIKSQLACLRTVCSVDGIISCFSVFTCVPKCVMS